MAQVPDSSSLIVAALSVAAASLVWWSRVRRLTALRNNIASITALSEGILAANTAEEAEIMAARGLESALGLSRVRVILRDQASGPAAEVVSNGKPVEPAGSKTLYLPMISGSRPAGAMELSWTGERCPIQADERPALAHLANQIAITLELHDRRFQREQILRGEKLGAAGRLIAAVAREMADPLVAASAMAESLPASPQARSILDSVAGAKQTLDRLLALGHSHLAELNPFDAASVAAGLVEFRRRNWEMRSLDVSLDLTTQPATVFGVRGAFEHALLDILVHAEQAAESVGRPMSIATKCAASSLTVEITHPLSGAGDLNALLELVASVVETLGGQARIEPAGEEVKWIISAPLRCTGEASAPQAPAEVRRRPLTLLLVDPNPASLRSLIEKLAHRGHRVVPAAGGGEAVEMANAIHCDAVLATPVLPDMTWPELLERTRLVGCKSILLCDSLAPMSHVLVQRGEALALRRPVDETDLDRVLLSVTPAE
jgi:signal transduction histidine kinase